MKSFNLLVLLALAMCFISCSQDDVFVDSTIASMYVDTDSEEFTGSSVGLYYYYQGRKIPLQVDNNAYYVSRYSVEVNPITSINTYLSQSVMRVAEVKNEERSPNLFVTTKEYLNSRTTRGSVLNMSSSYLNTLQSLLKEDADIRYITPCFVAENGDTFAASPYVYVKLKAENDTAYLKDKCKELSLQNCGQVEYMPLWYQVSCISNRDLTTIEIANRLYESKLFVYATPAFVGDIQPNNANPFYVDQWGLCNTGQYNGKAGIDICATDAHSLSGGYGINIGVVDYGVDYSHEDLYNYYKGYDAYKSVETTGYSTIYESNAHGTACAGIIGAQDNQTGVLGVALSSTIASISIPFSLADHGTFARGIEWAYKNKMDIISCSWSSRYPSDVLTDAIKDAVSKGRDGKGCVVVFATGNENNSSIAYPSSLDCVISVGAIDMFGKRKSTSCVYEPSWGSNYGTGLDVVAPGIRISTTDISGSNGYNAGSTWHDFSNLVDYTDDNYTKDFDGTSAAAPFVAGIAALILERKPNLTEKEVRSIIQSTCTKLPGYFSNDYQNLTDGTWNNEVGYGLVNAFNAISKTLTGDSKYTITGEPTITSSNGATFVVNNIPSGTYVSWTISDTQNFIVSSNGYNSVIVRPKATGKTAVLTAEINSRTATLATVSLAISSLY